MPSIALPKMMPMPTPAPTAPRPPPTPRPIDLPAFAVSSVAARMVMRAVCSTALTPLVVFGDRAAEVDSGEGGEDERLQGRHKPDLESEQRDAEWDREPGQGGEPE